MSFTHPAITLKSGLRIANFSSSHPFQFTTGEVLPACDLEVSKALTLESRDVPWENPRGFTDIELRFKMTNAILGAVEDLAAQEDVDVILVPRPIADLLSLSCNRYGAVMHKCRICCVADRDSPQKTIFGDKFYLPSF